jgi:ribonuclease HI
VSKARHQLLLDNRLRQGYASMHLYVRPAVGHRTLSAAAGIIATALRRPWGGSLQGVRPDNPTCRYLLFFDGGSRGNPGPGGSGAVVVRLTPYGGPFQLVWAGSMSYAARTTTNNMAENLGLLAGLTACNNYGFSPLHVIGDSAMIIRQHTQRKAPKAIHRYTSSLMAAPFSRTEQDGRSTSQYGDGFQEEHASSIGHEAVAADTVETVSRLRRRRYRPLAAQECGHGHNGSPS